MGKFSFGNGQYVVYAPSEQEALQIIGQELKRFDNIKAMMANLLTENGQALENFSNNVSEDRLNIHFNDEQSAIYDRDFSAKGEVRHQRDENGNALVDQEKLYKYELAYRYPEIAGHNADFRLAHEMGHLMLNASNPQRQGYDAESNSRQVSGLIRRDEDTKQLYGTEMQENAINLIAQLAIRGDIKADDIIAGRVDLSEFNAYKRCDDLVKQLAVSMRNDFGNEMSFEQLAQSKLDTIITREDGTKVPANTFFYGILNDSSIIQNEFDKYMGKGAWRQVNEAFSELYKDNISQEKFKQIFQATQDMIQEFANIRAQDKNRETSARTTIDIQNMEQQPEAARLDEYPLIRKANERNKIVENQNENKLTLKQRVAMFLQRNSIFMNVSFVENFVHQQLDILPPPTQETRPRTVNQERQDFLNRLTNNGEYRNLPPIQRMSDPRKLEEMRRKMEQRQQPQNTEKER